MHHLLTDQLEYPSPIGVVVLRLRVCYDAGEKVGLYEITESCLSQPVAPSIRVVMDLDVYGEPEAKLIRRALARFDLIAAERRGAGVGKTEAKE